jgi:CHAT domain-containing protein
VAASTSAPKTALLIGNPLFDLSANEQAAAERRLAADAGNGVLVASAASDASDRSNALAGALVSDPSHAFTSSRSRDMVAGQKLPPLPGTGAEVAAIAELMKAAGWKTELFTGQMALKRVVEEARSPRVVHLATHGFFLPDQQIAYQKIGQHPGLGVAASGLQPAAGSMAGGNAGIGAGPNASGGFAASGFATSNFEDPMLRSGLYFAGANRTLAGETSAQAALDGASKGGSIGAGNGPSIGPNNGASNGAGNGMNSRTNNSAVSGASSGVANAATNGASSVANGAANGNESNVDNGVLTALEAGNLDLTGTELVVLSACNTGQGEVKNGEGVFGLRRALEEAGAQSVMMSLWSVPDKETLELMKLFYAKWLSGIEKHEALKQAQLEMRQRVRSEHDGHDLPYYWAAFVLVGK